MPLLNSSSASVEYAKFCRKILPLLEPHLSMDRDHILNDDERGEMTYASELGYTVISEPQALVNDELLLLNI